MKTRQSDPRPTGLVAGRRNFLQQAVALGGAAALPAAVAAPLNLDMAVPQDNMTAYLKMRASVATGEVFFWFTGGLDLAVPGEPIAPIITVESLLRRQVNRLDGGVFQITDWEATVYRDPHSGEIASDIRNPVTGRSVQPLHYREGPVPFEFRADRQPRLIGMENPFHEKDQPFSYPSKRVGDDLWMTKSSYFSNRAHWLKIDEWPLEAPAENINVASISTLQASWSDIVNPEMASVPTNFHYQATSGWLPWMLMGQRPGFVIWHESGKKLASLDEAPADTLAAMERIHPQWFRRPVPWDGFTNMFLQYQAQRQPAR